MPIGSLEWNTSRDSLETGFLEARFHLIYTGWGLLISLGGCLSHLHGVDLASKMMVGVRANDQCNF